MSDYVVKIRLFIVSAIALFMLGFLPVKCFSQTNLSEAESRVYREKLVVEAKKYVGPDLIVHGDADKTINISYGIKASETYNNAKFISLHGEDHGFSAKGKIEATKEVYKFLCDNIKE